jgi:ribosome-associated protein
MSQDEKKTKDVESLARRCVEVCEERKAADILLFDVRENSILADFYIVCSGTSMPHIRAIGENLRKAMLEEGLRPRGQDGLPGSRWLVLDYGSVLIHILDPEMRDFYNLEELWDDRKIIYRGGSTLSKQGQTRPRVAKTGFELSETSEINKSE